ncbi:MAG TPA: DinB family protein, partial [Bryobacteraceae bacterium]|jgi:uncharacterized damage-inducible protein DinB|nr:DinB family protein [Bryobacteraceae bacterium]
MVKIAIGAFLICGALSFCALPALSADDTAGHNKVVDELVKHWTTSKELSLAVANAMPEADYSFKATAGEMSFGEQMNHIAAADSYYCSTAAGTKGPFKGKPADDSKSAAIKNLTVAYDYCIDSIKELSDASLQKSIPTKSGSTTPFELFWGGFTHAAHHRGQAEVYLRLKGITPPEYKF